MIRQIEAKITVSVNFETCNLCGREEQADLGEITPDNISKKLRRDSSTTTWRLPTDLPDWRRVRYSLGPIDDSAHMLDAIGTVCPDCIPRAVELALPLTLKFPPTGRV